MLFRICPFPQRESQKSPLTPLTHITSGHTCYTHFMFYSVMTYVASLWKKIKTRCETHITRITHITLFFINGLSRRGFIEGLCFFCVICVICVMFFSHPKITSWQTRFTHSLCSTLWWLFDELVKKDKNTLSRLLRNTCYTHYTNYTHYTFFH